MTKRYTRAEYARRNPLTEAAFRAGIHLDDVLNGWAHRNPDHPTGFALLKVHRVLAQGHVEQARLAGSPEAATFWEGVVQDVERCLEQGRETMRERLAHCEAHGVQTHAAEYRVFDLEPPAAVVRREQEQDR